MASHQVGQSQELLARARATWAAGDYDSVAAKIAAVGERIVRHTDVREGDVVLDVACGTGNATIPAARAGARVTGVDLTPELFEPLRAHARSEGVEVELVEADAQALPFEDASFDVVLSTFGVMFAPDHQASAGELARVLAPGGRLGLCNWTPEGELGRLFRTVGSYMQSPPEGFVPPVAWGSEEHVSRLFAGTGVELEFDREHVEMQFDSVDDAVEFYETRYGPVIMAKRMLQAEGGWPALRDDLAELFSAAATGTGPGLTYDPEYLVALGRRAA